MSVVTTVRKEPVLERDWCDCTSCMIAEETITRVECFKTVSNIKVV